MGLGPTGERARDSKESKEWVGLRRRRTRGGAGEKAGQDEDWGAGQGRGGEGNCEGGGWAIWERQDLGRAMEGRAAMGTEPREGRSEARGV